MICFAFAFPLWAEESDIEDVSTESESSVQEGEEVINLGTIYVEESLPESDQLIDRPTSCTAVINPRDLVEKSVTLPEVLESVPGVSVRNFGGLGSLSTISIRGSGSKGVLVLLDDVPLNPSGGYVDLSNIPLTSLDRVEVIRGGEGAILGGGAVGGVIRLYSNNDEKSPGGNFLKLSAGSFNTSEFAVTLREESTTVHLTASGSRGDFPFKNDNGTYQVVSDDFKDIRENNEAGMVDSRITYRWQIDEHSSAIISGEWFRSEKGIPGITTFPSPHASQTDSRQFLHAVFSNDEFQNGRFDFTASWLRQARHFSDPYGESTGVPVFSKWIHERLQFDSEWIGPGFSDTDSIIAGTLFTAEQIDASNFVQKDRNILAVWGRNEWYFSDSDVLLSALRLDIFEDDMILSPKVGARISLAENLSARANLGMDFRPPGFEELYRNEGLVTGNPSLKPERSLGFDLGLSYASKRIRGEAAYFNIQTRDMIDYLLVSGFRWKPYNIGRTRCSGFEFSLDYPFAPSWGFRANCTVSRAVDTSGDPNRNGMPLVGQPSSDLFASITWGKNPWKINLDWEYRGSSPITPSGTRFLPSCNSFASSIGYSFSDGQTFTFEVKNLFDQPLTDIRGFPLPGRTVFLTYANEW